MKNSDQPAFPISETNSVHQQMDFGLTKREYFAALAMQGILANEPLREKMIADVNQNERRNINDYNSVVAKEAVLQADELLKQLES